MKYRLFLVGITIISLISCNPKNNYCNEPETIKALKQALILDIKDWKDNAKYLGIDDFESRVEKVVNEIKIVETSYIGGNKNSLTNYKNNTNSCRCKTKIRIKNHDDYIQSIKEPIAKIRTEEHPTNSKYLRLKGQMNYLDNDGFIFSYVVLKEPEKSIKVSKSYPFLTQTNIDNAGSLIFNYITANLKTLKHNESR